MIIPVNWLEATLGELTQPTRPRHSPQLTPKLPFIGLEHVEPETMKLLGTAVAGEMKSSAVHFQAGDVLYGRLRPYLNKVIRPSFEGLCSAEFIVLPGSDVLDSGYLAYFLNAADFVRFATHLNTGDRPRVDFGQIASRRICIPPLAEQRRIVTAIEEHFSALNAAVVALKRARIALPRYRAAVLKAACEGKLVDMDGLRHSDSSSNTDASTVAQPLYQTPPAWRWVHLREIADLKGGITKGQTRRLCEQVREVPYLRVANVQRGFLDLEEVKTIPATDEEIQDLALRRDDVLFNEGGDRDKLGRGWVWEGQLPLCIHQNHVFRARVRNSAINPRFLSWYGNSFGQKYFNSEGKQTTNLASINLAKLGSLPVPLPPVSEQQRIVAEVNRRLSLADAADRAVEAGLAKAKRLRQAILRRAFEGNLVRPDPNEEPASLPLEQTRTVRRDAGPAPLNRRRIPSARKRC